MADVDNMDDVTIDTTKYPEWIAHDCCYADLGTVRDAWRGERCASNAPDDVDEFLSDSSGDHRAGVGGIIRRDACEISKRFSRSDDLHPR
ncbi:hypothetical protein UNPA324_00440 [Bradyrhizobium sp. UNPA324]|nr:hypothetical protein UNPA324_00440 [Bradyrhizobium sp. UNPA324]